MCMYGVSIVHVTLNRVGLLTHALPMIGKIYPSYINHKIHVNPVNICYIKGNYSQIKFLINIIVEDIFIKRKTDSYERYRQVVYVLFSS